MTMIVEVINARPNTWYNNKMGWRYEVNSDYCVVETENDCWNLCFLADDVKIIRNVS